LNEDDECSKVISKAWNSLCLLDFGFIPKVKIVTEALTKWSRTKFLNGYTKVLTLQQQLQDLINQQHYHYDSYHYDRVEAAKLREEIRWTLQ